MKNNVPVHLLKPGCLAQIYIPDAWTFLPNRDGLFCLCNREIIADSNGEIFFVKPSGSMESIEYCPNDSKGALLSLCDINTVMRIFGEKVYDAETRKVTRPILWEMESVPMTMAEVAFKYDVRPVFGVTEVVEPRWETYDQKGIGPGYLIKGFDIEKGIYRWYDIITCFCGLIATDRTKRGTVKFNNSDSLNTEGYPDPLHIKIVNKENDWGESYWRGEDEDDAPPPEPQFIRIDEIWNEAGREYLYDDHFWNPKEENYDPSPHRDLLWRRGPKLIPAHELPLHTGFPVKIIDPPASDS